MSIPSFHAADRARNASRRAAVSLIHKAWVKATDADVSEQLHRVMDYLMTPEGLIEHSALVVEVSGHEITLREKGRRLRVAVPIIAVYDLGFKIMAREARIEKLKKRGKS